MNDPNSFVPADNLGDLELRGADPVIQTKSNRKVQRPIDKTTYALRNCIERFFNRLKY